VNQIIPLWRGAGLVLCVLRIHINETVLDANGAIDQHKIGFQVRGVGIHDQIKVCLRCLSLYHME
jgi:hypothetical protein